MGSVPCHIWVVHFFFHFLNCFLLLMDLIHSRMCNMNWLFHSTIWFVYLFFYGFVENLCLTKPLCSKHSTMFFPVMKTCVSCLGKWLSLFLSLPLFLSFTCLPICFSLSWKYFIYSHTLVMGDLINLCYMWMCVLLKCLWI